MIRLVKVKQEFYSLCQEHNVDEELLFNEAGRPCVLLIRMNFERPHPTDVGWGFYGLAPVKPR